MAFGGQTIIFVDIDYDGASDALGEQDESVSPFVAPGCRHRPLAFKELVELGYTVAEQRWRSTIPLRDYSGELLERVMGTKSNDVIIVDGIPYEVDGGIRSHPDLKGRPFKATIISKLHVG